jgi:hypothetical protein
VLDFLGCALQAFAASALQHELANHASIAMHDAMPAGDFQPIEVAAIKPPDKSVFRRSTAAVNSYFRALR